MTESLHDENLVRYMDGEMDEEERLLFEQRLKTEPALRQQLEQLETSAKAVRYYGLVQQVSEIHQRVKPSLSSTRSSKVVPLRKFIRYSIAAAASLLFLILAWQAYNFYKLSPEAVYAEAFVDYNLPISRSNSGTDTTSFVKLYKAGNYDSLLKLERKWPASTDTELFLSGLAHLKTEDPFSAIVALQKVAANSQSEYKQDAEYYLVMAYLKNKDYDKAIDLMQAIHNNPAHIYNEQFSDKYMRKVQMLKWR